jgi:hypothetical protein
MTERPASKLRAGSVRGGYILIGERQTFEDITLNRRHSLGTAAMTIADAQPGTIGSAKGQSSNTDPAEATTIQTGRSRKVRLSVGD